MKSICDENGLKYYLIGGTLLGAVRHNGFIPWDDDIDIVMYRKDIRALEKIISDSYCDEFFVQNQNTDPHYVRYITKIRLNGTRQEEAINAKMDMHKGIYIDIFPLDYVTKNKGISMILRGKMLRGLFALKTVKHVKIKNKSKWKRLVVNVLKPMLLLFPDKLINFLFDWVCGRENEKSCKYTANFSSHFGWKKQTYLNEVYGEGKTARFEDEFFRVPAIPEAILNSIYGENYMELPPEEKRNSGHSLDNIDLGKYENMICGI